MSDYSATFSPRNKCVLLNSGNTFALCTEEENHHNNSLRRLNKDRRRRAKRTRTAGDCGTRHSKNALTDGHCGCR